MAQKEHYHSRACDKARNGFGTQVRICYRAQEQRSVEDQHSRDPFALHYDKHGAAYGYQIVCNEESENGPVTVRVFREITFDPQEHIKLYVIHEP